MPILVDTRAWAAIEMATARGAILAGCSAGAMMLGAYVLDIRSPERELHVAFNKLPHCSVLPHFDRIESFRPGATLTMRNRLTDGQYILGIDEHTALVGRMGGEWDVMGMSSVLVLTRSTVNKHATGAWLRLPAET